VVAERTIAPYGSWVSPFPISRLTDGVVGLGEVKASDGIRWWLEGRPAESGRQVLVRRDPDGTLTRLTPEGFNVRSRVQEYGGTPYAVHGGSVIVSDFASGRLQRLVAPAHLEPLTPARAWRYADLTLDAGRGRLLAVREDHEPATLERHGEAENSIVAVDLGSGEVTVLLAGADFYGAPRLSPDGRRLAWLEWRHPNMPWDGTLLRVAELDAAGQPLAATTVAGSASDWIAQPRWSPLGILHYVAEPDGWMNIFRWLGPDAPPQNLTPIAAEFASPDWVLGNSSYGFTADGSVIAIGRSGGRSRLYRVAADTNAPRELDLPYSELSSLAVDSDRVVLRAGSPTQPPAIVDLEIAAGVESIRVLRRATPLEIDPADISVGRHVSFPTGGGRGAFANFYPPHNRAFRAPDGELPPLIVTSHGGPTAEASSALSLTFQLLTSRGFAVLDVDYGGSTGYGRDYRRRLEGQWGVVDVDDCVNGARWLAGEGLVDPARMAVRGGSASGYLALCAVTFRDDFGAGVSYFGIGDLETFDVITHKFESKYTQRLVGPYPERRDLYVERSPLNFVDRIDCPLLILQGLDDRIVPPAQAEQIVTSLRARGLPYAYLAFEGEDHGFRQAKNIVRSFEAELSFYGQVFGFEPADQIEPIEIVNVETWRRDEPD
jgi:dipeptidyl aminopeptidase/acylaminoacyl peptidase